MELATPTGCTGRRTTLPWGNVRPHTITDFTGGGYRPDCRGRGTASS
jgi:hypothetical protein